MQCISPVERVDKVSTRWQSAKKEVIFCQFEFVGVRLYDRVQIGKKQAMERNFRKISLHLNIIIPFFILINFRRNHLTACGRTTFSTV